MARRSRRRTRAFALAVATTAALMATTPGVESLAAPTVITSSRDTASRNSRNTATPPPSTKESFPSSPSYYLDEEDEDEDEDWQDAVSGFQRLQKSTGSEVLQKDLQQQIDQGAAGFLESSHQEAPVSELEKLAMSSITEQLPQAAMKALLSKSNNNSEKYSDLNFSKKRVTAAEEIELARLIQTGVGLFKIKSELELQMDRPLTRPEWAAAAGLKNSKQLRQQIVSYRQAKHDLVTANLGLVHTVVQQFYKPGQGVTKEELVQEGSLGLLRAAELFDPERGLRFSTYAVVWIKGVLQNTHVPELVRVPARERTKWNKIHRAMQEHQEMHGEGSAPSLEELAASTGMPVQQVIEAQRRHHQTGSMISLDQAHQQNSRSGTETTMMESNLLDRNSKHLQEDADLAERTQMQADLIAAMARNLDSREARLMRLRYGLSDGVARSLQECADSMGLSYSRVHQLSKQCLEKLRQAAEAESLEEYLLTIA